MPGVKGIDTFPYSELRSHVSSFIVRRVWVDLQTVCDTQIIYDDEKGCTYLSRRHRPELKFGTVTDKLETV